MSQPAAREASDAEVLTGDGIGVVRHGDLLIALYAADASTARSRWLFGHVEQLIERSQSIVALVIIPQTSKPPNAGNRAFEEEQFRRFGQRFRRLVALPEGSPFFVSVVRLVVGTKVAIQRKSDFFFFGKNVDDAVRLVLEAKTPATPSAAQIESDIEMLRAAVAQISPAPASLRAR